MEVVRKNTEPSYTLEFSRRELQRVRDGLTELITEIDRLTPEYPTLELHKESGEVKYLRTQIMRVLA